MRRGSSHKSRVSQVAGKDGRPQNRRRTRLAVTTLLALVLVFTAVTGSKVQCQSPPGQGSTAVFAGPPVGPLAEKTILAHLKYLASDDLQGRATGEKGGYLAADYIAEQFRKLGLTAPGDAGYFQRFDATVGVRLGEGNLLKMALRGGQETTESTYVCGEDFMPFSFSSSGSVLAPVTFAGYGISSEQFGYDDYANTKMNGNVALVMRHEPGEKDSSSVFHGTALTHYADLRYKATNARDHGASAVMVTTDPLNHPADEDELIKLQSREGLGDCGIPAIQIKRRIAESMLRSQGLDLSEMQARIDSSKAPDTIVLPHVRATLRTDLVKDRRSVANVIGVLTPRDREVSEYVVVGAHYDHLGMGGESSLSPQGGVHNGADDNASGVAAMLELSRLFAAHRDSLRRGIIFIGFVGEEIGVLGSTYYVNNPVMPLGKTELMLNLDTVGRMRERRLYAAGVGSSPVIKGLIERANGAAPREGGIAPEGAAKGKAEKEWAPLEIVTSEGGYGPSDHFPFYGKNVPVLFFFTGANEDYHKVSDDWQKINMDGLASVVELSSRILAELVFTDAPVPFTRAAADTAGPPGGEGYGRGSGVRFGIVPDFGGEPGTGAKITGTSAGSPAEKAGLKPGDVIVRFGGKTITGLEDLSYALRDKKPGDEVEVVVVREGKEMVLRATLDRRGAR